jgi:hypothetical protein
MAPLFDSFAIGSNHPKHIQQKIVQTMSVYVQSQKVVNRRETKQTTKKE